MSNPFELRFKVLEMSRDLCMDHYQVQVNAFTDIQRKIEDLLCRDDLHISESKASLLQEMMDDLFEASPVIPSPDAITAKAKELYKFVETK